MALQRLHVWFLILHEGMSMCADSTSQCPYWASIGECEANPTFMTDQCQKSCGECVGEGLGLCEDNAAQCPFWSAIGECDSNPVYMNHTCVAACRLCSGDKSHRSMSMYSSLEHHFIREPASPHPPEMSEHLYDPKIYIFEQFLTQRECDVLMEHALPHLQSAVVINQTDGRTHTDKVRTNKQMSVSIEDCREHPVISTVIERMHNLARIPLGHGEQLQIGRYEDGQFYEPHFDSEPKQGVVRASTIIVYLTEPAAGGQTIFPKTARCYNHTTFLDCCNMSHQEMTAAGGGLVVEPKQGLAVLFYSHDLDGRHNHLSMHGACPVLGGEKWIAQQWFRTTPIRDSPHYGVRDVGKKNAHWGIGKGGLQVAEHLAV